MAEYMVSDGDLCRMTGVLVTVRGRNPYRSGQPQIYVWLPGRQACSVYGSVARYHERRPEYVAFVRRWTGNDDEAAAIMAAVDEIAADGVPTPQALHLVPVSVATPATLPTVPSLIRYEVRIGKWAASVSREVL